MKYAIVSKESKQIINMYVLPAIKGIQYTKEDITVASDVVLVEVPEDAKEGDILDNIGE